MRKVRFLLAAAVVAVAAGFTLAPAVAAEKANNKRLLLVTHSGGFVHDSVGVAEEVLKGVGPKNGFGVTCYRFTGDPDKKVKGKGNVETTWLERYGEEFRARTGVTVGRDDIGRVNKETLKNFDCVLFFTTGS